MRQLCEVFGLMVAFGAATAALAASVIVWLTLGTALAAVVITFELVLQGPPKYRARKGRGFGMACGRVVKPTPEEAELRSEVSRLRELTERQQRLIDSLGEKLLTLSQHLSRLAERRAADPWAADGYEVPRPWTDEMEGD